MKPLLEKVWHRFVGESKASSTPEMDSHASSALRKIGSKKSTGYMRQEDLDLEMLRLPPRDEYEKRFTASVRKHRPTLSSVSERSGLTFDDAVDMYDSARPKSDTLYTITLKCGLKSDETQQQPR
jgi:hypothetical protein